MSLRQAPMQIGPIARRGRSRRSRPVARKKERGARARRRRGRRCELAADAERLRQVFVNLVDNAVKFTPQGGTVTVRARVTRRRRRGRRRRRAPCSSRPLRRASRCASPTPASASPAPSARKVFDAFYQVDSSSTREYGGTGLGLSIVKRIVEAHGGTVAHRRRTSPSGTVFIVTLPSAQARAHAALARSAGGSVVSTSSELARVAALRARFATRRCGRPGRHRRRRRRARCSARRREPLVWTVDAQVEGTHFRAELAVVGGRRLAQLHGRGERPRGDGRRARGGALGARARAVGRRRGARRARRGQAAAARRGRRAGRRRQPRARDARRRSPRRCSVAPPRPSCAGARPGDGLWLAGPVGLAGGRARAARRDMQSATHAGCRRRGLRRSAWRRPRRAHRRRARAARRRARGDRRLRRPRARRVAARRGERRARSCSTSRPCSRPAARRSSPGRRARRGAIPRSSRSTAARTTRCSRRARARSPASCRSASVEAHDGGARVLMRTARGTRRRRAARLRSLHVSVIARIRSRRRRAGRCGRRARP